MTHKIVSRWGLSFLHFRKETQNFLLKVVVPLSDPKTLSVFGSDDFDMLVA